MAESDRCPTCGAEYPPGLPIRICVCCVSREAEMADEPEYDEDDDGWDASEAATLAGMRAGRNPDGEAIDPGKFHPYRLVSRLGEGGFAEVFLARQTEPIRRMVALKVLKQGSRDANVAERFELERQALARMEHPNICRIYDAGSTDDGTPYFAMEVVKGEAITEFCQSRELTLGEVIRLFIEVCEGVVHAHQRGILHRDLKPSNIIVTERKGTPVPVVIDFGIAKVLEPLLDSDPLLTGIYQVVGTPAYMSPERARGGAGDADVRSDVYSLGVILYEMLTSDTPVPRDSLSRVSFGEALRLVSEARPVRPSVALTERRRATSDGGADEDRRGFRPKRSELTGDLDWIVMKAVENDPSRRYQSAGELAADLERFLECRPVSAGPPGIAYRARKFVQRHRVATAAVMVGLLALAAGAGMRRVRAIREAEAQFDRLLAAQVEEVPFLLSDVRRWFPLLEGALGEVAEDEGRDLRERVNASLVLAPERPAGTARLADWLLNERTLPPRSLRAVQAELSPQAVPPATEADAWRHLSDSTEPRRHRLRAAALLAKSDPIDGRWMELGASVALLAASEGPVSSVDWAPLLEPVAPALIESLGGLFLQEQGGPEGGGAAVLLARYHRDNPAALAVLASHGDPLQFDILLDGLEAVGAAAEEPLAALLAGANPATGGSDSFGAVDLVPRDVASDAEREFLARDLAARSRSRAGLALLRLGFDARVWPMLARLREAGDPSVRTHLIHGMSEYGVHPSRLTARLAAERDPSVRAALLLALGDYDEEVFPPDIRIGLKDRLATALSSPDAEEHAVAEWLVRSWGDFEVPRPRAPAQDAVSGGAGEGLSWRRNQLGLTMIRIPGPIEFMMGSPEDEPGREDAEFLHARRIPHGYEISDKLLTRGQAYLLMPDLNADGLSGPELALPITGLSRQEARTLCNKLSANEGIPESEWAYGLGEFGQIVPVDRFPNVQGYRLATEPEWEFAARAHAVTARFYGFSPDLLPRYAWINQPTANPLEPGLLRPNSFGLFDVLGNVFEYVEDDFVPYPGGPPVSSVRVQLNLDPNPWPVLRGMGAMASAAYHRIAGREEILMTNEDVRLGIGFRVARTIQP